MGLGVTITGLHTKGVAGPVSPSPGFWSTPGDQVASLTSCSDSWGVGGVQGGLQWRGPKS